MSKVSQEYNYLSKKIGIIGGGQLGKMMILDAKCLGFYVVTLDPTPNCPSHSISDEHIVANFDDKEAFELLASKVDVITYEFEHISVESLKILEEKGHTIYPTVSSLEVIQNKYSQKVTLKNNNIPIPDFESVSSIEDIQTVGKSFGYPMMLKACTGGYDGKGNALIKDENSIDEAFSKLGAGQIELMIERFVPFIMEVSVLACRGIDGEVKVYPVAENIHVNSILDETIVPANIPDESSKKARDLANKVMEVFNGVGMFCVEMFVCEDDSIYINEVAPRPHNSGHYTIEGCYTSQFEQHIRAIANLPLGDVSLISPVVMKNIIGDPDENGRAVDINTNMVLALPKTNLHLYGKEQVKPYRKMGHITTCHVNIDEAKKIVREAHNTFKIKGK